MEKPTDEDSSTQRLNHIHTLARVGVAATWIYHGLVPKLLFRDWSEMILLRQVGVDIVFVPALMQNIGCLEIAFGLLVLGFWRGSWQFWATIGIMLGSLLSVAQHSPQTLHAAFNPVTLNGLLIILSIVGLLSSPTRPTSTEPIVK